MNKPFVISGYLENVSERTWQIMHGAGMFTYEVVDDKGQPIPQDNRILFHNDMGSIKELLPNDQYRENGEEHRSRAYYEFTISEPGRYEVRVTADFRLAKQDGIYSEVTLISDTYKFHVR